MFKLPYGYKLDDNGTPMLDAECAKVVKTVYTLYLAGNSLGKISDILFKQKSFRHREMHAGHEHR